jgi:hypothetical protein
MNAITSSGTMITAVIMKGHMVVASLPSPASRSSSTGYTKSMTRADTGHFPTTIKVSSDLRDRLKVQAGAHDLTLGEYLSKLATIGERQMRREAMHAAVSATAPELLESYREETEFWDDATDG